MVNMIINLRSDVIQTLSGTVTQLVTDVEDNVIDGFTLKDATGQVTVDTNEGLNLTVGEAITVIGESAIDDDGTAQFEALKITKADGTVVLNPSGTAGAAPNDDILDGTNQRNVLNSGVGRDFLKGRGGKDTLSGGDDSDILIGGRGKDVLTGGEGKDTFGYELLQEGGDRITDFNVKQDVIEIDDGLFKEGDVFESKIRNLDQIAEFVKLTQVGSRTVVSIDPDGEAGSASFTVLATLAGVNAMNLGARNFIS